MGRFNVTGEGGLAFLQSLLTNDLSRIGRGRAQYNLKCDDHGGILEDLVVYWGDDGFTVGVNAANRERDLDWMRSHAPSSVEIEDGTCELALIAFQGPRRQELWPAKGLGDLPYFGFRPGQVAGVSALVSRTGYTGEDGFEIFVSADRVGEVWDAILKNGAGQGVLPAGLGARDATRLEAALRLYGNDMEESVNPYEAGLGWTVRLGKGEFIGRDSLVRIKSDRPGPPLVGLSTAPGNIARHGAAGGRQDRVVGSVASGTHSVFLGHPIALALVEVASLRVGGTSSVDVRGRHASAEVVQLPFYRGSARSAAAPAKS